MTAPMPTLTDETAWPDPQLDALRVAVLTEQERRRMLATGPGQIADLAQLYTAALGSNPAPIPWTAGDNNSAQYGPGVIVTKDGKTYRNDTGGTLNGSYIPGDSVHPFWTLIPAGGTAIPFTAGMALTTNEYVTNVGNVWQYLGADVASAPANWAPTQANATWALIGPAT